MVLFHLLLLAGPDGSFGWKGTDDFLRGGWMGLDLFFVLSGFLITAVLLSEREAYGSISFRRFYGRRALRLLPALYVLLGVHLVYAALTSLPWRPEYLTARDALVYGTNWQIVSDPGSVVPSLVHLWSLAVEEQFYIVWPLLLTALLRARCSVRTLTFVLSGLVVLVALHRLRLWDHGVSVGQLYVRTDTRADSLLAGATLATLWVRGRTPRRGVTWAAWAGAGTFAVLLPLLRTGSGFNYAGGFTLIALAAAAMVLGAVDGRWSQRGLLVSRPLRTLGRVSYGLYLWHVVVFYAVARYTDDWPALGRVVFALVVTAALTAGSWWIVERPALRFKARLVR